MAHITTILKSEHPTNEIELRCRQSKERSGISSVLWLTTFNCNLRCSHCYTDSPRENDQLNTQEAVQFIHHLEKLGVPLVFLSGGEPLIREDIAIILKALHEAGIRTVLSTNGTLITPENLQILKDTGVAYVAISLHASSAIHDELTGVPGTFDKVANSIRALAEYEVPVCLKSAVTQKTYQEIPWVLEWGIAAGIRTFYICDLIPAGRGCGTAQFGGSIGTQEWLTLFDKLLHYIETEGIFIDIGAHPSTVALVLSRLSAQDKQKAGAAEARLLGKNRVCPAGKGVVALMPDGGVTPCNFMPELVLGNIREKPVEEINKTLSEFLGDKPAREPCHSCRWVTICGGCRAKAYYMLGDARDADPTCLIQTKD